nr:MAG TPA: hypothetical protein [Caudoviricetes sp.]
MLSQILQLTFFCYYHLHSIAIIILLLASFFLF